MDKIAKQNDDFSAWYSDVIKYADLADYGPVKGTMIIKPYGYAIWENIQRIFDNQIKAKGIPNVYFPLFIPESFLSREADHVEGFSPELAVVTHAGGEKLTENIVVRPTSETIMYDAFSRWIGSYRDLPYQVNQWVNVVRWEKKTKPFIRTSEFLWQEGHSVLSSEKEVDELTLDRLAEYETFIKETLAIPPYVGKKTNLEKFAGAVYSTSCEVLLKDGKALQSATSHNLGQNFSKVFDISFETKEGKREFGWQSSWGMSTRVIGALIMMHGDDKGLVLPPAVAPVQVVVIPIYKNEQERKLVMDHIKKIDGQLKTVRNQIDDRDNLTPGWKFTDCEIKGIPIRLEVGPKDVASNSFTVVTRTNADKSVVSAEKLNLTDMLAAIQSEIYDTALKFRKEHTYEVTDFSEFKKQIDANKGFYLAPWCMEDECELEIKEKTGATTRVIPFEAKVSKNDKCICCGKQAKTKVYLAKAY